MQQCVSMLHPSSSPPTEASQAQNMKGTFDKIVKDGHTSSLNDCTADGRFQAAGFGQVIWNLCI